MKNEMNFVLYAALVSMLAILTFSVARDVTDNSASSEAVSVLVSYE